MFTQRQFAGCTLYAGGSGGRGAWKQGSRSGRDVACGHDGGLEAGLEEVSCPAPCSASSSVSCSASMARYLARARGIRRPRRTAGAWRQADRPGAHDRPRHARSREKQTAPAALRFPARIILSGHDEIVAHRCRRRTRIELPGPTALWNFGHSTQPFTTISKNSRGVLPVPILRPRTWPAWQPGLF